MTSGPPLEIKVGHKRFAVEVMEGPMTDRLFGYMDPKREKISVSRDQTEAGVRATLLHEVLHAIFDVWPHELTHDEEEQVVKIVENGLLTVIEDNPRFVEYLVEPILPKGKGR